MPENQRWRDVELTTHDGISLISRIWLPEGDGPWPTLLMRQPYGRAIASTVTIAPPCWWTQHGFLVVIQDVRGQGDSGGEFHGFRQEAADTAVTHRWLRTLPECNGKIGTYGFSYQGLTQLLSQEDVPPPSCLAPAMTGLDEDSHWSREGGAEWWHLGLGWGLQLAALRARRYNDNEAWTTIHHALADGSYLYNGLQLLRTLDPNGMVVRWFDGGKTLLHQPPINWLRQPMLLLGGWWDPHLCGLIDLYERSQAAGGRPELYIGPATHLSWWPGVQNLMLDFFQRHLQNRDSEADGENNIRLWDIGRQRWQFASGSSGGTWSLYSSGLACHELLEGQLIPDGTGAGCVQLVHDPWRPAPAIGGHLSPTPGLVNRVSIDCRSDVATFTSAPLTEPLCLEGRPRLSLTVQADQPGFDLCIALSRVLDSTNCAYQLTTGVRRFRGSTALAPQQCKVLMQPLLTELALGERLRLSLAAATWPAIGVNPGHSEGLCGPPSIDCQVITLLLYLEESRLDLLPLVLEQATKF